MTTETALKIGCQIHDIKKWEKDYLQIAKDNGCPEIAAEYKLYIDLACKLYVGKTQPSEA